MSIPYGFGYRLDAIEEIPGCWPGDLQYLLSLKNASSIAMCDGDTVSSCNTYGRSSADSHLFHSKSHVLNGISFSYLQLMWQKTLVDQLDCFTL